MKEIITAAVLPEQTFHRGEKVVAINWFEKYPPYSFGTYIRKFSDEDKLSEGESCKKIDKRTVREYNIGEYKVVRALPGIVQIVSWEKAM